MIQIEIDMEMPKRCLECRLEGYRFGHRCCDITCMPTTDVRYSKRLDSCPLHESVAVDHLVEADKKDDPISRQAAIDALMPIYKSASLRNRNVFSTARKCMAAIEALPSAQPEPAIPLQWIEGRIKWLKSLDNAFSTLTAGQISAMVNKWKDEQNERSN